MKNIIQKRYFCFGLVICALLCLSPDCSFGQINVKPADGSYDFSPVTSKIQEWVDKGYYPGVRPFIAKDNKVVCEKYFGNYTPQTEDYIASAGKWLGAATIALLVDEGKLSWNDPVSKWLPEFTDSKEKATLRQLLSHTSGFPNYHPKENLSDNYPSYPLVSEVIDEKGIDAKK